MKRVAILTALIVGLFGACAAATEDAIDGYDLPDDQYPPLNEKADGPIARMQLSDAPRGTFSYGDAAWMAFFSRISYLEPAAFTSGVHLVAPEAKVTWWQGLTSTAFYVDLPKAGVLVFRGTNSRADWITNLNADPWNTRYGYAHKGFYMETDTMMTDEWQSGGEANGRAIRDFIASKHSPDNPEKPLYITGHSLGGAMAEIAYVMLELDGCRAMDKLPADARDCAHQTDGPARWIPVHAVYTFGAPRFGGPAFSKLAGSPLVTGSEQAPLYRFVNRGDIVTRVPDTLRYTHPIDSRGSDLSTMIHLGQSGITYGRFEGEYPNSEDDHSIERYALALERHFSGPSPNN